MKAKSILPELESFDSDMINYAKYLIKKGILSPPHYFNLILGNIATSQANLLHAGLMIQDLPDESKWSLGGIGDSHLMVNSIAIAYGGGVRVVLEDNLYRDSGRKYLASNCELLKRIHTLAAVHERKVMQPSALRKILKLKPGSGDYGR
jgi:uncharacterized protein (DUF849 family)